jgi:hypothetical protein
MQSEQGPYGDFLNEPGNLALMLNMDWFNPFTRTASTRLACEVNFYGSVIYARVFAADLS